MNDGDRQVRAMSFGSAAEDYAQLPPRLAGRGGAVAIGRSAGLVVDLAAGTGNLARRLLRRVDRAVAVDIDPRMLAALGNQLPGVARVATRGEELPFGSAGAGAVVISSAWHWLDPQRAWPEIGKRRGGRRWQVGAKGRDCPSTRLGSCLQSGSPFRRLYEPVPAGRHPLTGRTRTGASAVLL